MKRILSKAEKERLVRRLKAGERFPRWRLRLACFASQAFGAAGANRKLGPKPGGRAAAAPSTSPDAVAAA